MAAGSRSEPSELSECAALSRIARLPGKKLAGVLYAGESLRAAGAFHYPFNDGGPSRELSAYHRLHGRDPRADLVFERNAGHGYVGVTDSRLVLAKSPLFFASGRSTSLSTSQSRAAA
jgi:hypothetical protein